MQQQKTVRRIEVKPKSPRQMMDVLRLAMKRQVQLEFRYGADGRDFWHSHVSAAFLFLFKGAVDLQRYNELTEILDARGIAWTPA